MENANNTDTFTFPGGSFFVTPKFAVQSEHLHKATCLFTANLRLTYKISHGAGRFAGIRSPGRGTLPTSRSPPQFPRRLHDGQNTARPASHRLRRGPG